MNYSALSFVFIQCKRQKNYILSFSYSANVKRIISCANVKRLWRYMYIIYVYVFIIRVNAFCLMSTLENCLRPRNINWQDWKYTSFVIFICYSQNIQYHNAMGGNLLRTSSKTKNWNSNSKFNPFNLMVSRNE